MRIILFCTSIILLLLQLQCFITFYMYIILHFLDIIYWIFSVFPGHQIPSPNYNIHSTCLPHSYYFESNGNGESVKWTNLIIIDNNITNKNYLFIGSIDMGNIHILSLVVACEWLVGRTLSVYAGEIIRQKCHTYAYKQHKSL